MSASISANNKPKRTPVISNPYSNPLKLFIEAGPSQNIRVTLAPHSWMFLHFNTFLKLKAPRRRKPFSRIFKDSGSSGNNTLAGAPRNRSLRGEGADACAGSIHVHLVSFQTKIKGPFPNLSSSGSCIMQFQLPTTGACLFTVCFLLFIVFLFLACGIWLPGCKMKYPSN